MLLPPIITIGTYMTELRVGSPCSVESPTHSIYMTKPPSPLFVRQLNLPVFVDSFVNGNQVVTTVVFVLRFVILLQNVFSQPDNRAFSR